jgi:hypothetical protein
MDQTNDPPMTTWAPAGLPDDLAEAYVAAADLNLLAALNPEVFFGYFSVCADGGGHGSNTTYPGLDWGQSAEALLWLGRTAEVLASWDYVKRFVRPDGRVPFAIIPDLAGKTTHFGPHPLRAEADGAILRHWVPGDPLRTLANVTFLLLATEIWERTWDHEWLLAQADPLRRAARWLYGQVKPSGLVPGAGFYIERPTRVEYDGVNQCMTAEALRQAAYLLEVADQPDTATECGLAAGRVRDCFQTRFWADDHCVEYIHPERGPISHHGLTDVDWAAIATLSVRGRQIEALWPQLCDNADFLYGGMPTGISTRPETYEDWEMQFVDRHDLAAMGRVWYLECWARSHICDHEGLMESLRRVAAIGKREGWSWRERYYSERTGELTPNGITHYCEYPANFIRVVHEFVLR